jgi:hypothetical protein
MLPKRKDIRQPLLAMLADRGGSARPRDLYSPLAEHFRLNAADLAETCGGDSKWQAMVREARDHLVEQGLIHPATGKHRGVWTLTAGGRRAAQRSPRSG